jgi:rare lipoprotein A
MPRALPSRRKILSREPGGAVNRLSPQEFPAQITTPQTFPSRAIRTAGGSARLEIWALGLVCAWVLCGCSARHPVADRQPAPAQPRETPEKTAEAAKRATDTANIPSPAPNAKRGKGSANAPMVDFVEEGNASWYGVPFNGRRASNGEIYDMYKLTAAHRTLPFETMVKVTNLNNGKSTTVRITDRGPFVDNRIIDLSMAAAREIESIGPGVVPVRIEILTPGVDPNVGFFTVQVGAFRERLNAERLRDRLSATYSPISIQSFDTPDGSFFRVRVGKISGEEAAHQYGEQLRTREGFNPIVVRLDENAGGGGNQ